jgi:structural maintenance of chromosomes protein 5
VEFAGLSPVALLTETQRAAAPERMIRWHDELKTLRTEEKRLEIEHGRENQHLQRLQASQNATRDDVRHWHERQDLIKKANALERCRPIIESRILKNEHDQAKTDRDEAIQELGHLEAEVAPARRAEQDAEEYKSQIDAVRRTRLSVAEKEKQQADKIVGDLKAQHEANVDFANQIEAERSNEKQRRQELNRIQNAIKNIERSMQDPPADIDEDDIRARRTRLRAQLSGAEHRGDELREQMESIAQRARQEKMNHERKKQERASLDTQTGQQASRLQGISRDTAAGWDWFQKNRGSLQLHGEVHGPPILTCSVADSDLAHAVEGQLKTNDVTAITCTDGRDARLLSNKLLGEQKLHQVSIRTIPQPLAFYRPPINQQELSNLGFEGYILDYIQGPDAVLAMLCDNAQLHRTAFSRNTISNDQYQAIQRSSIASWIAGGQKYRISRRREYGQSSTSVNSLYPARFFTNQPVDAENKRQLDNALRELERDLETMKQEHGALKAEQQKAKADYDDAKSGLEALKEEESRIARAKAAFDALPIKRDEKQRELDTLRDTMSDTARRVREHKASIEKGTLQAASLAVEYAKAVSILRQKHENLIEAELRSVEAISELEALQADNAEIIQSVNDKKKEVDELKARLRELKNKYNEMIKGIKQLMQTLTPEENDMMAEFQARLVSVEDLDNEVEAVNSKLGLMADGNANAVRAYEKREQEIVQVQAKLEKAEEDLEATKAQVRVIREQWEPELDRLVAKISDGFSHNFAQIGCAGEVGVYKDEEFENWSIQIQVRFR